jgi:hypothetical protein
MAKSRVRPTELQRASHHAHGHPQKNVQKLLRSPIQQLLFFRDLAEILLADACALALKSLSSSCRIKFWSTTNVKYCEGRAAGEIVRCGGFPDRFSASVPSFYVGKDPVVQSFQTVVVTSIMPLESRGNSPTMKSTDDPYKGSTVKGLYPKGWWHWPAPRKALTIVFCAQEDTELLDDEYSLASRSRSNLSKGVDAARIDMPYSVSFGVCGTCRISICIPTMISSRG